MFKFELLRIVNEYAEVYSVIYAYLTQWEGGDKKQTCVQDTSICQGIYVEAFRSTSELHQHVSQKKNKNEKNEGV